LNVIEMGDGIYGVEAASQFYFNKTASKLSKPQAALIAATLPNPLKWKPTRVTKFMGKRQAWILKQMNNIEQPEFLKKDKKE